MNSRIYSCPFLFIILWILIAGPLQAQDTTIAKKDRLSIVKGTILTGFSVDGITASRDDYNHEFERAFSRMRFNIDGMYFLSDRIGVGPILGYEFQFRDFNDSSGFFDSNDQWNWRLLYGARAGWYIPMNNLFFTYGMNKVHPLLNTYLFFDGGISWVWSRRKIGNRKFDPENRFGYQIGAGLLVPVGKRISLEWKLGWEARREHYRYQVIRDGQVVLDFNEKKWLKELSFGLGLKVIF